MPKTFATFILLLLASQCGFGQVLLGDVDNQKIHNKKILRYAKSFDSENCHYFSDLEASACDSSPQQCYSFCEDTYSIKAPVDTVWETCTSTNPAQLWNGKRISLAFIYNSIMDRLLYSTDMENCTLENNQIYFINLNILRGLLDLPTALTVVRIDKTNKRIVFSYLKGGKSEGWQELCLLQDADNTTRIIHKSHFKSNSQFRDKRLYPFFHRRIVRELHKNIEKQVLSSCLK